MTGKSKIVVLDKYSEVRDIEIVENIGEPDLLGFQKTKIRYEKSKKRYCSEGDELEILTQDAGVWSGCVVVRNKKGETFTINWNDLIIDNELD